MTDENTQKQPLSMTRRYRRGLILTGVLCVLAMLTAATLLFQRSYVERVDSYIAQICDGYAAAYKVQDTHDAMSFAAMLPEESARTLRFTLIDANGTVLLTARPRRLSTIVPIRSMPSWTPTCPTTPTGRSSARRWRRAAPA